MEKKTKKPQLEVVDENNQKLTYEQLNQACIELSQQIQTLRQQNQALVNQLNQINNAFRRLDYLFAVLQHEAVINDPVFISKCVDEVKAIMTIPSEPEDKAGSEEKK